MSDRRLPPVTELAMASLALIVVGGIYLSSYLPGHVSLALPTALLVASVILLAANLFLLTRVPSFPWQRFVEVGRWALLAYLFISAMIEYAFLQNHLKGGALVILTLSLLVFAVHVPTLIAFTVARFHEPDDDLAAAPAGP